MAHIVTENCIKCKYTDCVEVCPVDCFHEGPNFLVIDPDECIDCTLCVAECPVRAIFPEDELPHGQEPFIGLNAELARRWPVIALKKGPPPDARAWDGVPNKLAHLDRGEGAGEHAGAQEHGGAQEPIGSALSRVDGRADQPRATQPVDSLGVGHAPRTV